MTDSPTSPPGSRPTTNPRRRPAAADDAASLRRWAQAVTIGLEPGSGLAFTRTVADRVAAAVDVDPAILADDRADNRADCLVAGAMPETAPMEDPPGGWANPWLVGAVHEQAVGAGQRRRRGAWYTPEPVVRGLVDLAFDTAADRGWEPELVIDPTCGGGAFLLAAADRLVSAGVDPVSAVARLAGMDVDAGAVTVARWSLQLWAGSRSVDPALVDVDLRHGDALADRPATWARPRLVVGNPPFATPLRRGAMPGNAVSYREQRSDRLGAYADLAAVHLCAAMEGSPHPSMVCLVQPQSVLAGQDTAGLRRSVEDRSGWTLQALWVARESVFDADVKTCALVLATVADVATVPDVAAGADEGVTSTVALATGAEVNRLAERPYDAVVDDWGRLAARALGAPELPTDLIGHGRNRSEEAVVLGGEAEATAGFRDEFYGLVAACREGEGDEDPAPRLSTVGLVDPLVDRWGREPCRFGGTSWHRPVIELDRLEPKVRRWVDARRRPKVLVATQSKVLEPLVDRDGSLIPATPLIAVHAPAERLCHLAAVLLAPPVVAWAWGRWFGAALTVDGLKLAARQVLELPLPVDVDAWDAGAELVAAAVDGDGQRRAVDAGSAIEVARIMTVAYGADDERGRKMFDWWLRRLPGRLSVTESIPPTARGLAASIES